MRRYVRNSTAEKGRKNMLRTGPYIIYTSPYPPQVLYDERNREIVPTDNVRKDSRQPPTEAAVGASTLRRVVLSPSLRRLPMHCVVTEATSLNSLNYLNNLTNSIKRGGFFPDVGGIVLLPVVNKALLVTLQPRYFRHVVAVIFVRIIPSTKVLHLDKWI